MGRILEEIWNGIMGGIMLLLLGAAALGVFLLTVDYAGRHDRPLNSAADYFGALRAAWDDNDYLRDSIRRLTVAVIHFTPATAAASTPHFHCEADQGAPLTMDIAVFPAAKSVTVELPTIGVTIEYADGRFAAPVTKKKTFPTSDDNLAQAAFLAVSGLEKPIQQIVAVDGDTVKFGTSKDGRTHLYSIDVRKAIATGWGEPSIQCATGS